MKTLTAKDIEVARWIGLGDGFEVRIETPSDRDMGPPWEEHDGHGPVTGWAFRGKKAGERVLNSTHCSYRYYDFSAAVKIAKRDRWGDADALAKQLGREPTRGELAAWAAEADFKRLKDWCDGRWHWIGVVVRVRDSDGKTVFRDSVWGIEDDTDFWKDVAIERIDAFREEHERERSEARYWAERDVVTLAST